MSLSPPDARTQVPPVVGWQQWYQEKAATLRQGMHLLFNGPTQSGKTTLARYIAALRDYNLVLGTKPKDPSMDAYLNDGYLRIERWPTDAGEWKRIHRKGEEVWPAGKVWLVLWPKIATREDLRRHTGEYARAMESVFVDGSWTLVVDEGLWVAGSKGLGLGDTLSDIAYGSASNKVSMYALTQRPSGIPRIIWSSVSECFLFHGGVTTDVRELSSLGTYPPRDVARVIQGLRGHEFLDLPTRGQASWAVSEVEM